MIVIRGNNNIFIIQTCTIFFLNDEYKYNTITNNYIQSYNVPIILFFSKIFPRTVFIVLHLYFLIHYIFYFSITINHGIRHRET